MKISIQLYTLRECGDFDAQLALAARCGFAWVETVADHGLPAAEFARTVRNHGLAVSSMHASLVRLENDFAAIAAACDASGCPLVVMPWLPMGERPVGGAGWSALGERLAAIGRRLRAEGLRLAYHNHEFEFLAYDGRPALDWLFAGAAPDDLGWEADVGWICRAGADPFAALRRHGARLQALHVKDIAPSGTAVDEDGWSALGEGIVPWPRLLAEPPAPVELLVFEHDRPSDAERVCRTSRAFLARHAGH